MRRIACLCLLAVAACAPAQVWEKYLAPGLTYRMELDTSLPRTVHALRWSLRSPDVRAVPELANGKVYEETALKGRETVGNLVRRTGAIAGINGDFFPFTGDPLGLMVRDGRLLSRPYANRAAVAWGSDYAAAGLAKLQVSMQVPGQPPVLLDGFNEHCGENELVLNTDAAGLALGKGRTIVAVIRPTNGAPTPNGRIEGEVQHLVPDVASLPIGDGSLTLVGTGTKYDSVLPLHPGQRVSFTFSSSGFDWRKVEFAVGGGPFLVRSGQVAVDAARQGFDSNFTNNRHPRSAVGITGSGDLWFVTVDGRQRTSIGATLHELAWIMAKLGCREAVNLDGGGSTTLNVLGITLNRPSDGSERPVANAILFYGPTPLKETGPLTIATPTAVVEGQKAQLVVRNGKGEAVAHSEVLWVARGAGWIDQGGLLRTSSTGTVSVAAWVRGQILDTVLTVTPKPDIPPSRRGG